VLVGECGVFWGSGPGHVRTLRQPYIADSTDIARMGMKGCGRWMGGLLLMLSRLSRLLRLLMLCKLSRLSRSSFQNMEKTLKTKKSITKTFQTSCAKNIGLQSAEFSVAQCPVHEHGKCSLQFPATKIFEVFSVVDVVGVIEDFKVFRVSERMRLVVCGRCGVNGN